MGATNAKIKIFLILNATLSILRVVFIYNFHSCYAFLRMYYFHYVPQQFEIDNIFIN